MRILSTQESTQAAGILERKTRIPAFEWPSQRWAGESVVELYRDWGKPGKEAGWRQKIAAAPAPRH